MWPKIKKWLWRLSILVMIVLLLVIGALTFLWVSLQKPSYQEYYAAKIIEQLPEPWKSNARCGKIGGRLPGSFLLQDLKISTPNGDQVTLYNITLSWDWQQLLERKIVIHTIDVEKLKCLLKQSDDKTWLPDLISEAQPEPVVETPITENPFSIPAITFKLKTLALKDIQIQLESQEDSWTSLNYRLKNLNINAELENDTSMLSAALNLDSSMELKLDQYPDLYLNTDIQLRHHKNTIDLKLQQFQIKTKHSQLSLQSELQLKKFDPNDINIHNILKNLDLDLKLIHSKISRQDIKLFMNQFELPDDVALNGSVGFHQQDLKTEWEISCEKQNLALSAQVGQVQLDHPLDNQLTLKFDLNCSPDNFVTDLTGEALASLDFKGRISELNSWKLQQNLLANLSYKKVPLPEIKHLITLEQNAVQLQQSITDNTIELKHQLNTSLQSFANLQSIDPFALSLSNELNLNVPDLKILTQKWHEVIQLNLDLRGHHQLKLNLKGDMDQLSYTISTHNQHLYIDQALPNSITLDISGNASANKFMETKSLPEFPELNFTQDTLQKDLQHLGNYLNTWVDLIELPHLKLVASGNELHPLVEKVNLSLDPIQPKQIQLSLNSHTHNEASLVDLQTTLRLSDDQWVFELLQLKLNSQLAGKWDHSWLKQVLMLESKSALTLDWEKSELTWTPLVLGNDRWFKTEGRLQANGNLEASLHLQTPELHDWLKNLPISLPLRVQGNLDLDSTLSGSWFRPMARLELQSENLKLEKTNLPTLSIDKLSTSITLDTQNKKLLQLELLLKPQNETGFQGNLQQSLDILPDQWLPELEKNAEFILGTIGGPSMSLRLAEYFLPENINQLKGKWGLGLKGNLPLLKPTDLDFSGSLFLKHFSANIQEAPKVFKEANMELSLKPNQVELTELKITQEKGFISLSGNAFSDNLMTWHNPRWNIDLQMQQWQTKALDFASMQSASKIRMHGNLHQHLIDGFVEINDFTLLPKNLPITSSLSAKDPNIEMVEKIQTWEEIDAETKSEKEKVPNILKNAHIQVEIRLKRNNWVRDDMFTGELVGKLMVQKDFLQESLHPVGTISLQKAAMKFQGNRFTMEKGDLNWQGDLIPAIDFTFITKVDPYEIELVLREDQADQVKPEFSSQPWLDNSDIISVLIMGKPLHSESEGSGSDSFAQDLAVSQGVSQLSKEMGLRSMGIDIDNVSSKGGTVRVGRYLHPRLYVAIAKTIGDEESNELSLEYLILKNLKFKVTQETQVPMGFDLEWTKDY